MPNTNQKENNIDNKDLSSKGLNQIKNINKYIIIIIIVLTILIASIISLMIYKTLNKNNTKKLDFIRKDQSLNYFKVKNDIGVNLTSIDVYQILKKKDAECINKQNAEVKYNEDDIIIINYNYCRIIIYISVKGSNSKITSIKY